MTTNEAKALRRVIEGNAQATSASRSDDENIQVSVLYPAWVEGEHSAGEVYNAELNGEMQTWECYQDYDNAEHPDIIPGNAAWFTFNRPLHGKSKATARAWVAPTHAEDIYRLGEWMIFTDGVYYECLQDTAYSPADYAAAWRAEE